MPDTPHHRPPIAAVLSAAAILLLACGGGPRPPAAPPPQTPGPTDPGQSAAPPPEQPAPPPARSAIEEPGPTAPRVVIEPAEPDPDEELTLAEAARRERARRRQAGEPIAVINDANLGEHAVGQLTFMEDEPPKPTAGEATTAAAQEGPDEQYWRDRVRDIRQRWADTAARLPTLEERVAELRRRFYEADDAYYRDTRIKPAWDRAIDQIAQSRAEAEAHKAELEKALAEGRLAGALPGWLREGIELEPEPFEPQGSTHEPGEPRIVEPGEADGP